MIIKKFLTIKIEAKACKCKCKSKSKSMQAGEGKPALPGRAYAGWKPALPANPSHKTPIFPLLLN
jgi:hypothetical protein